MPNVGPLEIIVVLVIALVVFGPRRIPELGNSLGKGIREFRSSISGNDDEKPEIDSGDDGAEPVHGEVVAEQRS